MPTKSAPQIQADITSAPNDDAIKAIINKAPREFRKQLIGHAVTVRGLRKNAEMKQKRKEDERKK